MSKNGSFQKQITERREKDQNVIEETGHYELYLRLGETATKGSGMVGGHRGGPLQASIIKVDCLLSFSGGTHQIYVSNGVRNSIGESIQGEPTKKKRDTEGYV